MPASPAHDAAARAPRFECLDRHPRVRRSAYASNPRRARSGALEALIDARCLAELTYVLDYPQFVRFAREQGRSACHGRAALATRRARTAARRRRTAVAEMQGPRRPEVSRTGAREQGRLAGIEGSCGAETRAPHRPRLRVSRSPSPRRSSPPVLQADEPARPMKQRERVDVYNRSSPVFSAPINADSAMNAPHDTPMIPSFPSRLPNVGTTIFTVMSALAAQKGAVNLGQGFPDFDCDPRIVDAVSNAMRDGHNQYPPMAGAASAAPGDLRQDRQRCTAAATTRTARSPSRPARPRRC
jgi:hypothetical protein